MIPLLPRFRRCALLAGIIALPFPVSAGLLSALWERAPDPVAVSSVSTENYAAQKFGPKAPKPETYLFFQGHYFGGTTRDPDLEHAQFLQIAQTLGENMVRQNYFPTKDQKNADLLIAVHWGVTTTYENPNRQMDLDRLNDAMATDIAKGPNNMDHSEVNSELAIADLEQGTKEYYIKENSRLLGFDRQIAKEADPSTASGTTNSSFMSSGELDLRQLLDEERFFVILMAYDYHTMKKGTKPTLLWSTRFSVRAASNRFTVVLPEMSKAAADYFGRNMDGLKFEAPGLKQGQVDVGTPTVVKTPAETEKK
ncbi:MAG TPA: hypothetical protein VG838_04820 [Opitutaceae bacterium]|nr:hypothetical protein [Opitutaceae bacterium]